MSTLRDAREELKSQLRAAKAQANENSSIAQVCTHPPSICFAGILLIGSYIPCFAENCFAIKWFSIRIFAIFVLSAIIVLISVLCSYIFAVTTCSVLFAVKSCFR